MCNEIYNSWLQKFDYLGIKTFLLTGDTDPDHLIDLCDLKAYQIIVTTPEKWDSLTRKWKDSRDFISAIKLFLVDEVHLLNDQKRGPVLEAIVSRIKTFSLNNNVNKKINGEVMQNADMYLSRKVRIVVLSATVSNVEDLGHWLNAGSKTKDSAKWFRFEILIPFNCIIVCFMTFFQNT